MLEMVSNRSILHETRQIICQEKTFHSKLKHFDRCNAKYGLHNGRRHLELTLRFWGTDKSNDFTLVCGSKSIFFIKIENLGLTLSIQTSFI